MQEKLLEELNKWHTDARSFAKSTYEAVEKTNSELQEAVKFSERLLHYGSAQMLPMRQMVLRRILSLSSTLPHAMRSMKFQDCIEFETDVNKFHAVVQASFGHFANGDGTTCCMKVDNSLCLGDEIHSKSDVISESLTSVSQVYICFCYRVIILSNNNDQFMVFYPGLPG